MKKESLLYSLETLRIQSEVLKDEPLLVPLKLIDILLAYIGDKDIRDKVDEVVL